MWDAQMESEYVRQQDAVQLYTAPGIRLSLFTRKQHVLSWMGPGTKSCPDLVWVIEKKNKAEVIELSDYLEPL